MHAVDHPLDEEFPEWGESRYFTVKLEGELRLCDLLAHLFVLVPVLDAEKHYWVGEDEVEKLLRRGEGWPAGQPERELIVNRYLKYRRSLTSEALAKLNVVQPRDRAPLVGVYRFWRDAGFAAGALLAGLVADAAGAAIAIVAALTAGSGLAVAGTPWRARAPRPKGAPPAAPVGRTTSEIRVSEHSSR